MARPKKEDTKQVNVSDEIKKSVLPEIAKDEGFVSKDDFNQLTRQLSEVTASLTIMSSRYSDKNVRAIVQETMNQGKTVQLGEVGNMDVEQLTDSECYPESIALDAFMEELITIRIFPAANDLEYDIFPISVNSIHQPMVRGADQKVKRKFVEVMARCRNTDYRQEKPQTPELDVEILHQLKPVTTPMYNFLVIEDKNSRGKAWIDSLLNEGH